MLIRLRLCAGWSAPLLFAYGKSRFCHDMTHIPSGTSCWHYLSGQWSLLDHIFIWRPNCWKPHKQISSLTLVENTRSKVYQPFRLMETNHIIKSELDVRFKRPSLNGPSKQCPPKSNATEQCITTRTTTSASNNFQRTIKCWPFMFQIKRICSFWYHVTIIMLNRCKYPMTKIDWADLVCTHSK